MLHLIIFGFAILIELIFAVGFSIYTISLIYSNLKGSPYVPTRNKEIDIILEGANLKRKMLFIELGCGDARTARRAALKYGVKAVAIDVNPLLIWIARVWSKIQKVPNITFKIQNILVTNLTKADVVYLFLMPKLIQMLEPRFVEELKPEAVIISHGFMLESKTFKLTKKIERRPFSTYYYRRIDKS